MDKKQIAQFIKKINYGEEVVIKYIDIDEIDDIKDEEGNSVDFLCAQAVINRYLSKNEDILMTMVIEINRDWRKCLNLGELKAILVHEVGHFYTGYKIIDGEIVNCSNSKCEYDAQIWALNRVKELGLKGIEKKVLDLFRGWENFKWKSRDRIYLMAFRLARKNGLV